MTTAPLATPFDPREFRTALGSFATGVTIVTTCLPSGEEWAGVTANSFNSVSLDPPLVLWSLAKNARSRAVFEAGGSWAVHILAYDQEVLSNRFATRGEHKFEGVTTERGIDGVPLLTGCTARLQCRTRFVHEGGDHLIFVGEVIAFDREDKVPLVFHGGRYALAARKAEAAAQAVPDAPHSFGEDFIVYLLARAYHQAAAGLRARLASQGLSDVQWFVLSSLTAVNHRTLDEMRMMYAVTGGVIDDADVAALTARQCLTTDADGALTLTASGRDLTLHVLAASKADEARLVEQMGAQDTLALRNQLRQVIRLTDPGLPDMWGRAPA
jgi:3-hydroxy-9,10-secoandrosta-1,3,5(10)-triene-9,17-dione monooxygenase reductase component